MGSGIEHRFVTANGLRFHVATAGEGDRLVLCLHGFPECWYSWRHQMTFLADRGYRVWAPDLRGYGRTDRPEGLAAYRIEELMADVSGLLDAAAGQEVTLLAHDWGAVIAWYFAMRRVRALDRLVICNVPHPAVLEASLLGPQLLRSWYVLFFQLPWLPEWALRASDYRAVRQAFLGMAVDRSRFPPEVLQVYRDEAARPGALTAMVNYYRALVRGGGAGRQRRQGYPRIDVPTLLLWGEQDKALGRETTLGTDRYVNDLTVRYFPDVSHWVQQEAPERVNEALAEWLPSRPT